MGPEKTGSACYDNAREFHLCSPRIARPDQYEDQEQLKNKAIALDLEPKESLIRLVPRGLAVVADTTRGPVRPAEMSGGENWLRRQLATLLSMHESFSEQRSPVPRFLIRDQPSQVYFPEGAPSAPHWPDPTEPPCSRAI
ncbi:DUF3732 domain-containing protein [Streptomyces mirabilis]|uniref:DUF3732 domain-containing protein n=1 Tax=Streptomyces mirabilis TaxID=68239 RepID=UPI00338F8C9B